MSVTVKSVYGDDIRRFVISNSCSFEDFSSQLRQAYGLENVRFSVRFLDDENELITVTTDAGLREALSLAVSGFVKILKFQIHLPKSDTKVPDNLPVSEAKPVNKPLTTEPAAPTVFDSVKAEPVQAPPQNSPPCKAEVLRLLRALFTDSEVAKILPSVLQVFQSSLVHPATTLQHVIDHILGAYPLIKNHPSVVALSPWLPLYIPKLEPFRQKLCQLAADFPCLLQIFENASNFGEFFGGQNPWEENEEEEDGSGFGWPPRGPPFAGPSDLHLGVTCDNCGMKPIQGVRYKCSVCANYDLCSACEATECHPADHPLIKSRAPAIPPPGFNNAPFGGPHSFMGPPPFGGMPPFGPGAWTGLPFPPGFGPGGFRGRRCGGRKWGCANGMGRAETRCWRSAQPLQATFVRECNLQDRTEVSPSQTLVKIWELQNSGAMAWPQGTKLTFARGDLPSVENSFDVAGPVDPGKTVQVSAAVRTPPQPGRYRAFFKLEDNQNNRFGPRLWCDVTVVAPNSASQVPEPDERSEASNEEVEAALECKEAQDKAEAQALWEKEAERAEELRREEECTIVHARPEAIEAAAAKYQVQLAELHSMGYTNSELNVYLLDQHQGNVERVCADRKSVV